MLADENYILYYRKDKTISNSISTSIVHDNKVQLALHMYSTCMCHLDYIYLIIEYFPFRACNLFFLIIIYLSAKL